MKPLTLLLPVLIGAQETPPCPTAVLDSGPVIGQATLLPSAIAPVNKFLGIPYAAKPQRFSLATKPEPWVEPLNASDYGPSCPQLFFQNGMLRTRLAKLHVLIGNVRSLTEYGYSQRSL